MSQPYLQIEDLAIGYRGKPLIEEIKFSLLKGEIVTLIGPNGVGKSTLLKSIAKQLQLVGGQVYLEGKNLEDFSDKTFATKAAIVFTQRLSPELMTVWEVVALGRYPYTNRLGIIQASDREIIQRVMRQVGIESLKDLQFAYLSDGQKQRVLLARAICQEPSLLILDEPTSYLDIKYKLEFLSVLQEMTRRKQVGVLMSLHELDLAERISDKIICIEGKRIKRYGTPAEIFKGDFIREVYGISKGSFDEKSGQIELERITGKSQVFVIAGNGSGRLVYRQLQRQGIPFTTGILAENDRDYLVAEALANQVIKVPAYEPITQEAVIRAKEELLSCQQVICCLKQFGTYNQENKKLIQLGEAAGIPIVYQ